MVLLLSSDFQKLSMSHLSMYFSGSCISPLEKTTPFHGHVLAVEAFWCGLWGCWCNGILKCGISIYLHRCEVWNSDLDEMKKLLNLTWIYITFNMFHLLYRKRKRATGFALKQFEKNFPKQAKQLKDFYNWSTNSDEEFSLLKNIMKSY